MRNSANLTRAALYIPWPVPFRSMKIGSFRSEDETGSNADKSSMSVREPLKTAFAFAHDVKGPLTALPYFFTDDSVRPSCRIQFSKLLMSLVGTLMKALIYQSRDAAWQLSHSYRILFPSRPDACIHAAIAWISQKVQTLLT